MTICERMFALLDERKPGKSPAVLGKILGVSTGQMTMWKQRNSDPPARYLQQISEYIGVSVQYLVTGNETDADMIARVASSMTSDEMRLLSKYRLLDEDGKDAVRGVLLQEQRRVESEAGMGTIASA